MNFSRKLILVAGAALLAACGDKVTVAAPVTPVPPVTKINSVDVAPATATITAGSSITFTAAVNADAGVTYTTAWSSSVSTITVSSAGVVTTTAASVTPGAAICATATAGTQVVKGCGTLVVTAPTATIPATVSISSITAGGLNTPVNPSNVANQMDVTLNVNPGNQTITKVELLVGGIVAGSQTFSAAQAAALRFSADQAVAAQTTFPQITFSVNTACYESLSAYCNALKTTDVAGQVAWLNGSQAVLARVYTAVGGSAAAASASATQTLTFNNINTFTQAVTVGGTTATANNAAGYQFTKGDVTASIIPVSYDGSVLASMTLNFGAGICNIGTAPALRSMAATAPATGATAWTATFAGTGTAATGNISGFSFNPACANIATGEGVFIAAAQTATGNNFTSTALPLAVGSQFRIDNLAPAAPAVVINPNGRANGWLNDAAAFTTITATGNDGMIAAAIVDAGVGGVTYFAKAGTGTSAAKMLAAAIAAADITTPATLAPSATNATYCLVQYSQDKLGNRSADPAACATTFGVDRYAPTIAYSGGLKANGIFAAAPGAEFIVTVSDTGLVGNSGLLPTTPVKGTVVFRGNGNTATNACFVGSYATATGCSSVGLAVAPAAPLYGTATMAATPGNTVATEGYYTFTATAYDAAGNSATVASRTTLVDATAPVVGAASAPISVAAGFTANAYLNENLDLQSFWFSGAYAAAPAPLAPVNLAQAQTQLNGYNAATFINTNYAASAVIALPFEIQSNMLTTLAPLTGVMASAKNQANTVTVGAPTAPTFTAPTAISITNMTGFTTPAFDATIIGVSSGLSTAATATQPATINLNATTTGATAIFNNPFARVDFYGLNVAGTEWRLLGSTTASTLVDNGVTRTFTYTLSVNGAAAFSLLGGTAASITQNVIAIGFNSAGTVGMLSAGALALPIIY